VLLNFAALTCRVQRSSREKIISSDMPGTSISEDSDTSCSQFYLFPDRLWPYTLLYTLEDSLYNIDSDVIMPGQEDLSECYDDLILIAFLPQSAATPSNCNLTFPNFAPHPDNPRGCSACSASRGPHADQGPILIHWDPKRRPILIYLAPHQSVL